MRRIGRGEKIGVEILAIMAGDGVTKAEVVVYIHRPGEPVEMHRLKDEMAIPLARQIDRMMWRDIEREFNFKASMRGKAMIRKRN